MNVTEKELLHIAKLSNLKIDEKEMDKYLSNLDNILNYVKILEKVPIAELDETIGANDNVNVFRKDEIKTFENREGLLDNAPEIERDMYKIPKVL